MKFKAFLFCLIVIATLPFSCASASLSENHLSEHLMQVPLPHGARVEWISKTAAHNGSPISIAVYDSPLSHQETLQFYQREWPEDTNPWLPGFIQTQFEGWLVISRFRDGVNSVVQLDLASPQRSKGVISIIDVRNRLEIPTELQSIAGVELLSHTRSEDDMSSAMLSVYQSEQSLGALSDLMLREFEGNGWKLHTVRPLNGTKVVSMYRQRWGKTNRIDMVFLQESVERSVAIVSEVSHEK